MNRPAAIVVATLLIAAALGWWLWQGGNSENELKLGGYIEAEQIQVGSRLAGRVARIGTLVQMDENGHQVETLVEEGCEIQAGQELVFFETDEVEAQLAEARAELEKAMARLAELRETREEEIRQAKAKVDRLRAKVQMMNAGPREEEIKQAEAMFQRSKAEYENARASYDRHVNLFERKAAAAETVDTTRKAMEVSRRAMEADEQKYLMLRDGYRQEEKDMALHESKEAEAAWDLVRTGPREEERQQAAAAVDSAKARIQRLEVLLKEATVCAPTVPGNPSVVFVLEAFDMQPGDMVAPGAPLATLVRKDQLWVRAFVPETDLGQIRDKEQVSVEVDSFRGRRFPGVVLRINRIAEFTPRNVQTFKERQDMMFPIKVRVEDPNGLLRPGMAATVHVTRKN